MKKIIAVSLILVVMLATIGLVVAEKESIQTKDKAENGRYLIKSNNGVLKIMYGVRHNFDSGFTTDLTEGQLKALSLVGVETEEVLLYHIMAKPTCNYNSVCEPELGENPSCADCKNVQEEPEEPICGNEVLEQGEECDDGNLINGDGCSSECLIELPEGRTCYPSVKKPWGIIKVNGGLGGANVTVAVLDTGIDQDHLDLVGNIIGEHCVGVGYSTCEDDNGHGTHVAGTIAADSGSDSLGILGVAPEAKIMALKVLDAKGSGYADDIAVAIDYAGSHGANIVSMSFGSSFQSSLIRDAINRNPNILYVAAAGNSGPIDGSIIYPAANSKVLAVGAIYSYEEVPSWSSRGVNNGDYIIEEREVEFGAPGVTIESTLEDGCYGYKSGTSMAAPHVAGLAAKMWNIDAATTRIDLQELAKLHDLHTEGDDTATGFGLPIAQ